MSTFHTSSVVCPCGVATVRQLAESANAGRHPRFREEVLAGTFMRFRCDACGEYTVVERELLYTDLARGQLIGVFPRLREAEGLEIERGFGPMLARLREEPGLEGRRLTMCRVVFGYAQLREKLVCADHGLDDRAVEGLKVVLAARAGMGRSLLVGVDEQLVFEGERGLVRVPRAALDAVSDVMRLLPIPPQAYWVSVARVADT